ncbi:hypothetical protein Alches_07560 [Alicyclobacillus hesperidum subsp. aegles]|uniref:FUSC family protein n=1 Tax=Alicyclobacillus hesperidum TaxID=89784 RepID=UPI00222DA8AF|nr:FUSC family protein [Alicyclobacillus hesperidum]GLG00717.1 hypothetical protein Alches_07560 [Alicyclobacillus hesperidum subsp. aegles]
MLLRRRTWRSINTVTDHDPGNLRIVPGIRNAFGVVLPLVFGLISQHVLSGVGISAGALVSGFAGTAGTARRRTRTMLLATLWMTVTTLVGAIAGAHTWLIVLLTMVSGWIAGMMIGVSAAAGQVGLLSTNALILISTSPQSPSGAFYRAGLVLAGGLLQMAIMIVVDLCTTDSAEADAVTQVYNRLATYARDRTRDTDLAVATALVDADATLRDSYMRMPARAKLYRLLNAAEQVRFYVVALVEMAKGRAYTSQRDESSTAALNALRRVSSIVEQVGGDVWAFAAGRNRTLSTFELLVQAASELEELAEQMQGDVCAHVRAIAVALRQLHRDLSERTVWHLPAEARESIGRRLKKAANSFLSHLTFHSATFRHALRASGAMGLGMLAARALPWQHAYWLPLTANIILRPDFTATFGRGIARVIGTVAGILLATVLMVGVHDKTGMFGSLLIVVFAAAMYMLVNFNYALFSCALTAETVVLLSFFERAPAFVTMEDRLLDTVLGSFLAFLVYLVWPTWQYREIHSVIADAVAAQRTYFHAVFKTLRDPQGTSPSPRNFQSQRSAVRVSRTNAAVAIRQMLNEPVGPTWNPHTLLGVLVAIHRLSDTLLSIEAYVLERRIEEPIGEDVVEIGLDIERGLNLIETIIRRNATETLGDKRGRERAVTAAFAIDVDLAQQDVIARAFVRMDNTAWTIVRMLQMDIVASNI